MRMAGRERLGFYPLPMGEAERIRKFLQFPATAFAAVDPCIGDGAAFAAVTADAPVQRYGIELGSYRAAQASASADQIMQGSCLDVHCPAESFSLLYLNPPYDWSIGESRSQRVEPVFLAHTYRWVKPGGILVLVIPGERIGDCSQTLAAQFRETRFYRLSEPECVHYKQVVVLAVRRSRYAKYLTDLFHESPGRPWEGVHSPTIRLPNLSHTLLLITNMSAKAKITRTSYHENQNQAYQYQGHSNP